MRSPYPRLHSGEIAAPQTELRVWHTEMAHDHHASTKANGKISPLSRAKGVLPRNRVGLLLALAISIVAIIICIRLIIPSLVSTLTDSLPGGWIRASAEQVLGEMERNELLPSQTPMATQNALQERFASLNAAPVGNPPPYRLLFRRSNTAANGLLSLPGGEIIITDQFLQRVPDQSEQIALLCHELGHLHHRHALRNAIEKNLFWLASAALVGSSEGSIRALAKGMNDNDYHADHVLQADQYALAMLQANGIDKNILIDAIEHGQGPATATQIDSDPLSHRQYFKIRIEALKNFP
jgi:Zn-dependent protease with chaperone function